MSRGWQPIASAKQIDRCLLWCSDIVANDAFGEDDYPRRAVKPMGVVLGSIRKYLPDGSLIVRGAGMTGDWTFTHWMPLPSPPSTEGEER